MQNDFLKNSHIVCNEKFRQTKVSQVRRKEMKNVGNGERNEEIVINPKIVSHALKGKNCLS